MADEKEIERAKEGEAWDEEAFDMFCENHLNALYEPIVTCKAYDNKDAERQAALLFPTGQTCLATVAMQERPKCPISNLAFTALGRNTPIEMAAVEARDLYSTICTQKADGARLEKENVPLREAYTALQEKMAPHKRIQALLDQKAFWEATKKAQSKDLEVDAARIRQLVTKRDALIAQKQEAEEKKSAPVRLEQQIAAYKQNNNLLRENIKKLQAGSIQGVQVLMPGMVAEMPVSPVLLEEKAAADAGPSAPPLVVAADSMEAIGAPEAQDMKEIEAPVVQAPAHASPSPAHLAAEKQKREAGFLSFLEGYLPSLIDPLSKQPYENSIAILSHREEALFPWRSFSRKSISDAAGRLYHVSDKNKLTAKLLAEDGYVVNVALNNAVDEARLVYKAFYAEEEKIRFLRQEKTHVERMLSSLEAEWAAMSAQMPGEEAMPALQAEVARQARDHAIAASLLIKNQAEIEALEKEITALTTVPKKSQSNKPTKAKRQLERQKKEQEETLARLTKEHATFEALHNGLLAKQHTCLEEILTRLQETRPAAFFILSIFAAFPPEAVLSRDWFIEKHAVGILEYLSPEPRKGVCFFTALTQLGFLHESAAGECSMPLMEQRWVRTYLRSTCLPQIEKVQHWLNTRAPTERPFPAGENGMLRAEDIPTLRALLRFFICLAPGEAVSRAWLDASHQTYPSKEGTPETLAQVFSFLQQQGVLQIDEKGLLRMPGADHALIYDYALPLLQQGQHIEKLGDWFSTYCDYAGERGEQPGEKHVREDVMLLLPHLEYYVQQHDQHGAAERLFFAEVLCVLAETYFIGRQYEKALLSFTRALTIQERLNSDSFKLVQILAHISSLHPYLATAEAGSQKQHRMESRDCLTRALPLMEGLYQKGKEERKHLYGQWMVDLLIELAEVNRDLDDPALQRTYLQYALDVFEKLSDHNTMQAGSLLARASLLQQNLKQDAPALENARRAYAILCLLDRKHASVAENIRRLVACFGEEVRTAASSASLVRPLVHPAAGLNPVQCVKQAILHVQNKQFAEAIPFYQGAIVQYLEKERTQGPQDDALRNVYFRRYQAQLEVGSFEDAYVNLMAAARRNKAIVDAGGKPSLSLVHLDQLKADLHARMHRAATSVMLDPLKALQCAHPAAFSLFTRMFACLAPGAPVLRAWFGGEGFALLRAVFATEGSVSISDTLSAEEMHSLFSGLEKHGFLHAVEGNGWQLTPEIQKILLRGEGTHHADMLQKVGQWLCALRQTKREDVEEKEDIAEKDKQEKFFLPHLEHLIQQQEGHAEDSPAWLDIQSVLGQVYLQCGCAEKGMPTLVDVVAKREQRYGPHHISLLDDFLALYENYKKRNQLVSQAIYITRALRICERHYKANHPVRRALLAEQALLQQNQQAMVAEMPALQLALKSGQTQNLTQNSQNEYEKKGHDWSRMATLYTALEQPPEKAAACIKNARDMWMQLDPMHPKREALLATLPTTFPAPLCPTGYVELLPHAAAAASQGFLRGAADASVASPKIHHAPGPR